MPILTHIEVGWVASIALIVVNGLQFLILFLALSLAVNVWSTAAIGYKTWWATRF